MSMYVLISKWLIKLWGSIISMCMYTYSVHVVLQETELDQRKADRHSLLKTCKVYNMYTNYILLVVITLQ